MTDTAGRAVDKRVMYLGTMLLTLAYPLIALTIIVGTQNNYDDEGHRITPLPQVTCPVEGAEGDIDCVPSPLAYAHIDSIIWVYVFNEVVMHFTYVLYTKLWATAGIVFGFWREFLSVLAFLAPELTFNSLVYLCQTLPFMRMLMPSLKTHHYPLIVCFMIGAMFSTLYGLGTAHTTDQFRRAVTLAGPGTMFLFVDWFSRSIFLPFFELMQNTFTQLRVNTLLLAVFELVLTNLYGSLFLPATQKLCVALARFFYNVSYGVDSKVSLYDYVNFRPAQSGLDPRDPMSNRTTLVSPKDIGTYEPEACRSSFPSLARETIFKAKSLGGVTSNVRSSTARSRDISVLRGDNSQRTTVPSGCHANTEIAAGVGNDAVPGAKQPLSQQAPEKEVYKLSTKKREQTAGHKVEGDACHNADDGEGLQVVVHKTAPTDSALPDRKKIERKGLSAQRNCDRGHPQERGAQVDHSPRRAPETLYTLDDRRKDNARERRADLEEGNSTKAHRTRERPKGNTRRKHSAGLPGAQRDITPRGASGSSEAVDVEAGRPSRALRAAVDHLLAAPHSAVGEVNDAATDNYPGHINEQSPCTAGDVHIDSAPQRESPNTPSHVSPGRSEERRTSDVQDDALHLDISPNTNTASGGPALSGDHSPGTLGQAFSGGMERFPHVVEPARGSVRFAGPPVDDSQECDEEQEPFCKVSDAARSVKDRECPSGAVRMSASSQDALERQGNTSDVVEGEETHPGEGGAVEPALDVVHVDGQQVIAQTDQDRRAGATGRNRDSWQRPLTPLPAADENIEKTLYRSALEGETNIGEDAKTLYRERQIGGQCSTGNGDKIEEPHRGSHGTRESAVKRRSEEVNEYMEEVERRASPKGQSVIEAIHEDGDDRGEVPVKRAHKKRQSAAGQEYGEDTDYVEHTPRKTRTKKPTALGSNAREVDHQSEEPARSRHKQRQSAVEMAFGGNFEDPAKKARKKRQSAVRADSVVDGNDDVDAGRRARRKRHSALEGDHQGCDDHAGSSARKGNKKRQSTTGAVYGDGGCSIEEATVHRRRSSAVDTDYESSRHRDGGRKTAEQPHTEAGRSTFKDGKAAAKTKNTRKNRRHPDNDAVDATPELPEQAAREATACDVLTPGKADSKAAATSSLPFSFMQRDNGRTGTRGPGAQNSRFSMSATTSGSGNVSPHKGSIAHASKDLNDKRRPFRSNLYIPYRTGFGSDAVEFEKIITWFNMIWDSWRFLLLRTVMVKVSNVFIFFIMIFKDFIYSMWHFCVRYDEHCILTNLELHSVVCRKNKSILKALDWFQALVVRPFFMPKCFSTTTWRSQLLFGLNAQKAQSRMRGVAVIRHSKRRDFGLRTLSNLSENAPPDAPNNPTPQKAMRGLGVMLKSFFKDLGHDLVAHFKVELELATTGFWERAHNKSRRFSKRRDSSLHDHTKQECDVRYAYGNELVVIRNVPVTVRSRSSRLSLGRSSRSNSETERENVSQLHQRKREKITFRDFFRRQNDSAFRKIHATWASQVVEELQSLIFNRSWPRLLQKLMSSLSLVVSDIFAEHTKVGLLPAYRTFGLFRTYEGRVRLFLIFSLDMLEVLTVWKVQSLSRFYRSIKDGFNNLHDGPLLLLCTINCAGTLMYFGLLRYIRFANIYGDKRILPDVNRMEMLTQLNLSK